MKYKVKKHKYLPIAIVRFNDKTIIMPANIECDPSTTLDDIEVIDEKQLNKIK